MVLSNKVYKYFLRQARADTKFGKQKLRSKKYLNMASMASKDLIKRYATVPAKIRAKESAEYLQMRAHGRYGYNLQSPLDRHAKRKYEKIAKVTFIK